MKCFECGLRLNLTNYHVRRQHYLKLTKAASPTRERICLTLFSFSFSPLQHQTSDFGQDEIFCAKCVPKVAPTQSHESVEYDRAKAASKMTQDVCFSLEDGEGP